ncbi:hypothetical protein DN051_39475 [Streptomyces cadmiisoli]|uniref:DNA (cytosine-5-)-methyltransferase n=1 Tax=Streptomyces cadmiisoli TaxID=2184053 RepID=A0A2Z4J9U7_9ACTN|nr:hypothetical protein DN051_39475 [Streptomyces cadmiisoli]
MEVSQHDATTAIRRVCVLRPRALNLYSCVGGAGTGLARAGFEVDGCATARPPCSPSRWI